MTQIFTELERKKYLYINSILTDTHLVDVVKEYKRLRQLQYDFEWDDNSEKAEFYKSQANYYKSLMNQGVLYDPLF